MIALLFEWPSQYTSQDSSPQTTPENLFQSWGEKKKKKNLETVLKHTEI